MSKAFTEADRERNAIMEENGKLKAVRRKKEQEIEQLMLQIKQLRSDIIDCDKHIRNNNDAYMMLGGKFQNQ